MENIKIEAGEIPVKVEEKEPVNKRIVGPHTKESRLVTEADLERVISEAKILYEICFTSNGIYQGAWAMHHSQIEEKDPLQLHVTADKKIFLNPVITNHSNYTVDSKEGCVSYATEKQIIVQRWQKIEVEYVTVMVDPEDNTKFKLSSVIKESLSGMQAKVFQHEMDHGLASYIYG